METDDAQAATIRLWSLRQDVLVEVGAGDESLVVVTRWGEFDLGGADRVVREALRRMRLGPISLENVTAGTGNAEDTDVAYPGRAELEKVLDQLSGSVVHSLGLRDGQAPLLSLIPVVKAPEFRPEPVPGGAPVRLSRFATIRPDGGALVLESPASRFTVSLGGQAAVRVVTALAAPVSIAEIGARSGIDGRVVADIVAYLTAAGVALVGDGRAGFAEDEDPALRSWSHHELAFHRKSRTRQGDGPVDMAPATDAQPPIVKPVPPGRTVALPRPAPGRTGHGEPGLTALLETDHTCPEFSGDGLSLRELGELLFRAARIRSIGPGHLPFGPGHEASQRPYFNVACLYELEVYLSIDRCTGLDRGIYHYDPLGHALTLVNDDRTDLAEMLDMAKVAAGSVPRPAALLSVTARPGRTSWALGGAAYATALAHFGALQQTLYLVAKAMGLAVHAVPVDDCDTVGRALGLDWPAEIGVGECVLDRES
ncbi:SagB-type dehydrogenase domain-containing protein [Amycolatopsis antarctica]|uniref:SagB-type dehydrogenase domain-containing protein n=1 Tax=Amycolatopsis antarctica TaxID=1854586 RepID=A0A263D0Q1_9PSEU|nr:SagB family peptide dehydrogenase [Amycolatopsis antarctica]OZM71931.1 SagB-type dehydrogenase domain-containing protein [Amycolatopsis antarctica]